MNLAVVVAQGLVSRALVSTDLLFGIPSTQFITRARARTHTHHACTALKHYSALPMTQKYVDVYKYKAFFLPDI